MELGWIAPRALEQRIDAVFYGAPFVENQRKIEISGRCERLDDLRQSNRPITNGIRGPEFGNTNNRMLRLQDIDLLWFDSTTALRVSDSQFRQNRRAHCIPGDILLAIGGYIGVVGKVVDTAPQTMGQHSALLALDASKVDRDYALAFFSSHLGTMLCQRYVSGGVQAGINLEDVREIRIPIPRQEIQRAIGNKVRKAERLRDLALSSRTSAEIRINTAYGTLPKESEFQQFGWHLKKNIETLRIDPWFHRPFYVEIAKQLGSSDGLKPVNSICKLVTSSAKLGAWQQSTFDYFEIGGINSSTGEAIACKTAVSNAPSRAKYLVQAGDVLVSTVRPNLKAVGQIDPDRSSSGVATSGFSVLRAATPELGAYVRACLVHDVGVHQLMRWNTGGTYPAIDQDVPGRVLIPYEQESATEIGGRLLQALRHTREAARLIDEARVAVEALIDGTLDEPALLAEGEVIEQWLTENPSPYTSS